MFFDRCLTEPLTSADALHPQPVELLHSNFILIVGFFRAGRKLVVTHYCLPRHAAAGLFQKLRIHLVSVSWL